jgi:two-component system, LytTR family, sensor kinase
MAEPTILSFSLLILFSLIMALAGLFLLANFTSVFRSSIRNEVVRKNVVAWLVIFCISAAMFPMNGGFFYILSVHGYSGLLLFQLISTTANSLFVYNVARYVAENKQVKKMSFLRVQLLIVLTLVIMTLVVNIPLAYALYGYKVQFLKFTVISSIYLSVATGLIYAVISYQNLERKRKFDEKELELSRLRELKTKAELDALHSKINPHFLYNALNSIADLSITDGKKGRKMTIALADLFRYSINYSNNNYSTVKDEVEMADVYLQIEKIRFEDQLNYTLSVEEGLSHFLVPRFVLQPLVENAVKHGLKATGQMTTIHLEVKRNNDKLVINVADNGPAFPSELVPGYGVKSVYDKLDLLFPDNYEMHFTNIPVKQVSLYIHKLIKDESAV